MEFVIRTTPGATPRITLSVKSWTQLTNFKSSGVTKPLFRSSWLPRISKCSLKSGERIYFSSECITKLGRKLEELALNWGWLCKSRYQNGRPMEIWRTHWLQMIFLLLGHQTTLESPPIRRIWNSLSRMRKTSHRMKMNRVMRATMETPRWLLQTSNNKCKARRKRKRRAFPSTVAHAGRMPPLGTSSVFLLIYSIRGLKTPISIENFLKKNG